jgi:regulator of cell morphogenesis and NO signaling
MGTEGTPATGTLRAALEREHHEIDGGVEDFIAGRGEAATAHGRLIATVDALRRHIYLEEEFLFPPLRASGMLAPVFVMLSEHRDLWRSMDLLIGQLKDDTSVERIRETCTTLLAQLDRHNSKEEPIIYAQADTTLSEDARIELQDFIDNEALPDGWVCQGL